MGVLLVLCPIVLLAVGKLMGKIQGTEDSRTPANDPLHSACVLL